MASLHDRVERLATTRLAKEGATVGWVAVALEVQRVERWATAEELNELLAIGDRGMSGAGDEARVDAIHGAIEARMVAAEARN